MRNVYCEQIDKILQGNLRQKFTLVNRKSIILFQYVTIYRAIYKYPSLKLKLNNNKNKVNVLSYFNAQQNTITIRTDNGK